MANDETMAALEALYGRGHELRGGFQFGPGGHQDLPFRPPGQEPARTPGPMYVDQVEDGKATLIDPSGHATTGPAPKGAMEGWNADGSMPAATPHPHYLPWPEDGIIRLGEEMPKVPLAPGSPGPPVAPGMNQLAGQKRPSTQQKKRRVTP